MNGVYLGLGSNKGNRERYLKKAIELISGFPDTNLLKISDIYETEPWGNKNQRRFLNLCLEIETALSPRKLLVMCQKTEQKLGRQRKEKWGPRIIDIDILLFGNLNVKEDNLIIPHPHIQKRPFVLVPLGDLNKQLKIKGKSVEEWLEIKGNSGVKKWECKSEFF